MSRPSTTQSKAFKFNKLQLIAIALFTILMNPGFGWANSFVLDPPSPSWPDSNDILRDNPGPWSSLPRPGVSSNTLGLGPQDVIDAISDGRDPIDPESRPSPIRILFSVRRSSAGVPGTAVRSERIADTAPPAPAPNGHASDIFIWYDTYGMNDLAPPPLGWSLGSQSGDEANARLRNPGPNQPSDNVNGLDRRTFKFKHPFDGNDVNNPDDVPNPGGPAGPGAIAPFPIFFSLQAGSPTLAAIGANPGDVLAVGGPFGANPKIFLTAGDLGIPNTADLDSLNLQLKKSTDGKLSVHLMRFTVSSLTTGFVVADGNTVNSGATILIFDTVETVVAHKHDELGLREEDDIDAQESVMTNEDFVGFDDSSIFIPEGGVELVPLGEGNLQLADIGDSGEDGVSQVFLPKTEIQQVIRSFGGQEGEEIVISPKANFGDETVNFPSFIFQRNESNYSSALELPTATSTDSEDPIVVHVSGLVNNEVIESWELSQKKGLVINLSLGWEPAIMGSGVVVNNLLLPAVQQSRAKILTQNENITAWRLSLSSENGEDLITRIATGTYFDEVVLTVVLSRFDDTPIAHFTGMDYGVSSMTHFEIQDLMSKYGVTTQNSTHNRLGDARVFPGFDGGTTVSQIGSSGLDGVCIDYGAHSGQPDDGDLAQPTQLGLHFDKIEWVFTQFQDSPQGINFATRFDSINKGLDKNTQDVTLFQVDNEQTAVEIHWETEYMVECFYQTALTGSFVTSAFVAGTLQGSFDIQQINSSSNGFEIVLNKEVRFEGANGKILKGDEFRFIRRRSVEAQGIINIDITGQNIPSFNITDVVTDSPVIFKRGDFDTDGTVGIGDAINTLGYLFLGWEPSTCMDAVDANDDGKLEIVDPIHTLSYLFLGTVDIPAPGARFCGPDPSDDELGCDSYTACD